MEKAKYKKKVSERRFRIARDTLRSFMRKMKWNTLSIETVGCFTFNWIMTRGRSEKFKPYRVTHMIVDIVHAVDSMMRPITTRIKAEIKAEAKRASAIIFKRSLHQPKKAPPYTIREVQPIIQYLIVSADRRDVQAATVLALAATSGSRTGDVLGIYWEDIIVEIGKLNYIAAPLRVSKNNSIPNTAQQLTACYNDNAIINPDKILKNWHKLQNSPTAGLVFPPETKNETTAMRRRWIKAVTKLGLNMNIMAHSARNNAVKTCYAAGVSETAMKSWLSWKNNSMMPGHYRGTMMDTHETGSAATLFETGFNQKDKEPEIVKKYNFCKKGTQKWEELTSKPTVTSVFKRTNTAEDLKLIKNESKMQFKKEFTQMFN